MNEFEKLEALQNDPRFEDRMKRIIQCVTDSTVIVHRYESECGKCGQNADPREKSHTQVPGSQKNGCGVKWDYIQCLTRQMGQNLRPDLFWRKGEGYFELTRFNLSDESVDDEDELEDEIEEMSNRATALIMLSLEDDFPGFKPE